MTTAHPVVPAAVFGAFVFAAIAELALPILILIVLGVKKKLSVKPLLLGFAAFFVSQLCLRLPILQVLGGQEWFRSFAGNTIPYVLLLAFTAGLFEESARYLCAGCFLKKERAFRDAVSFGLGHGFCEVILLTGMAQINNIVYSTMVNSGSLFSAPGLTPAAQQQILSALQGATPLLIYLGVLERVFTVAFHVFATVLIFKGVREHKIRFYFFALTAHTATDFCAPLLTKYGSAWLGEGFLLLVAIASVFLIFRMKPSFSGKAPGTVKLVV